MRKSKIKFDSQLKEIVNDPITKKEKDARETEKDSSDDIRSVYGGVKVTGRWRKGRREREEGGKKR